MTNVREYRKYNQQWTIQRNRIHTKICVEHHKMQKNTNNANKTRVLLQTTGGKDEPNIVSMRKPQRTLQHGTQNVKTHNRSKQKN